MSAYEKISSVKSEVESFKNARFFSMDGENACIVENTVNKALFSIPFEISESGITFDGTQAKLVKEKTLTPIEEFSKNKQNLNATIKGIFEEGKLEESLASLKKLVHELPSVDPTVLVVPAPQKEEIYEGLLADKVNAFLAEKKNYENSLSLFDEEQNVVQDKIAISKFKKIEAEINEELEAFKKAVTAYKLFEEELKEIVPDEKVREKLLKDVDLETDISVSVPRSLVVAKNTITEELNVLETSSKIIAAWKSNFFAENTTPELANEKLFNFAKKDQDRPKFLKFRMGIYTIEDAITLLEELDNAMSHYVGGLDDEELGFIANQKAMVEYMIRSRKISDRVMQQIVEEFNKKFKFKEDDYSGSEEGFKSRDEMKTGNPQGFVDRKVDQGA